MLTFILHSALFYIISLPDILLRLMFSFIQQRKKWNQLQGRKLKWRIIVCFETFIVFVTFFSSVVCQSRGATRICLTQWKGSDLFPRFFFLTWKAKVFFSNCRMKHKKTIFDEKLENGIKSFDKKTR